MYACVLIDVRTGIVRDRSICDRRAYRYITDRPSLIDVRTGIVRDRAADVFV